jgi:hypothetical protein
VIKDVAWKAQVRLCARYRRLLRAGKPTSVITVAIARELAAFVWAVATTVVVSRIFRIFGAAADPVKRFGW